MDNDVLAPKLHKDDIIHFVEHHRPSLGAGELTVTVEQTAHGDKFKAKRELHMAIQGPRFSLKPNEVEAVFPPRESHGDFNGVLPHVILKRDTLPWERTARLPKPGVTDPGGPWLALLVFVESEIKGKLSTVKANSLYTDSTLWNKLDKDPVDDPDEPVTVIDLPIDVANRVLPSYQDLPFLSSVRAVKSVVNPEVNKAIIMANREPLATPSKPVRYQAHLVSLEHQYAPADKPEHRLANNTNTNDVRLVSLMHWSFITAKPKEDLNTLLTNLTPRRPVLSTDQLSAASALRVGSGFTAVQAMRRDGMVSAAWYRGPLVEMYGQEPALPVMHAEALTQYDGLTGMEDISLSAAWELGRLLAMQNPEIGIRLRRWKRQHAYDAQLREHTEHHALAGVNPSEVPEFPFTKWFKQALILLHRVPFDYLVPNPDLLPPETIMPFTLDHAWLHALMDGAFSAGRTSQEELIRDSLLRDNLPEVPYLCGVLLRSHAVTGWPHLIVEGLDRNVSDVQRKIMRFDRLGKDTLLIIFEGHVDKIDIHPHPQAMHFSIPNDIGDRLNSSSGVIEIGKYATDKGFSVPELYVSVMKGVPRASFLIEVPR